MHTIPKDFLHALRQSGLEEFFAQCAYLPRAEYLSWIAAAKRPQTRRSRIQKSVVRVFAQWVEEVRVVRAEFDLGAALAKPRGARRTKPAASPGSRSA
jgi:hypothetical protein